MTDWTAKFERLQQRALVARALEQNPAARAYAQHEHGWVPDPPLTENLIRSGGSVFLGRGTASEWAAARRAAASGVEGPGAVARDNGQATVVHGHRLVPAPCADMAERAETLAADVARSIAPNGYYPPSICWFEPTPGSPMAFTANSHANDVFLRADLTDAELQVAVPHEIAHLHQFATTDDLTDDEAERSAEAFADKFARTPSTFAERQEVRNEILERHAMWRGNGHRPWG